MLDLEGEMCNFVLDMLRLDVLSKSEVVLLYCCRSAHVILLLKTKPSLFVNPEHSMTHASDWIVHVDVSILRCKSLSYGP